MEVSVDIHPNLEFNEDMAHLPLRESFLAIVTRVLHLHKYSNISKFSLLCKVDVNAQVVYDWISKVLMHNVGDLSIILSDFKEPFELPHCLFNRQSLTELCIEMDQALKLPPYVCFTILKVLTLAGVTFCDGNLTNKLFSGCPLLEELRLINCSWGGLEDVTISFPKLLYFSILRVGSDEFDEFGCKVNVNAASLESWIIRSIECYIHSDDCEEWANPDDCEGDHWYIELINNTSWVPPCFLSNLRTIEIRQFRGLRLEIGFLKILLKNAFVLEELVLPYVESAEKRQNIADELLSLPERSFRCSIVFADVDPFKGTPVFWALQQ